MAELTLKERLQPSLLDRLTDDEPLSDKESRDVRVWSLRRLREMVLRDLSWLLNCDNIESLVDLRENEHARRSVLNYGVQSLAGSTVSYSLISDLERDLRESIRLFEPRILPNSIAIQVVAGDVSERRKAITLEIRGELWARPLPQPLFLKTEVDLESGMVAISDLPT